ncbi:hypothetical protein EMIT0P171_30293 [Pseudomonas sp. IT-P171]
MCFTEILKISLGLDSPIDYRSRI